MNQSDNDDADSDRDMDGTRQSGGDGDWGGYIADNLQSDIDGDDDDDGSGGDDNCAVDAG